ncbi:unnamed protein product [Calypogeia fissa]
MDQELVREEHAPPDLLEHHETTPEQQPGPKEQTSLEFEPTSDQGTPRDLQMPPTPEGNEEALHQQQRHLRYSYPSFDLSEISYHTEQSVFPGSRHSSINTEPLTLDADQIHEAKHQAVDVVQSVEPKAAFEIFTKDTLNAIMGRVSMMEYYFRHGEDLHVNSEENCTAGTEGQVLANQINTIVERAQQAVEANEQQQSKSVNKTPGGTSALPPIEDKESPGNLAGCLEDEEEVPTG